MQSPDQMKWHLDNYPIQCLTARNITKSITGVEPTLRNHTGLWQAVWDMLYEQIAETMARSYSDEVHNRRMLFCCFLLTAPDEFLIPFIEEWSNKP
jgi:hypothetical protein